MMFALGFISAFVVIYLIIWAALRWHSRAGFGIIASLASYYYPARPDGNIYPILAAVRRGAYLPLSGGLHSGPVIRSALRAGVCRSMQPPRARKAKAMQRPHKPGERTANMNPPGWGYACATG